MGKCVVFILMLLMMPGAQAQTACPSGVTPGSAQCGPSPTYHGVGNASTGTYQPPAPVVMQQKWADRWGAIVMDENQPILGTSSGEKNKRTAEKKALSECKSKGGTKCFVSLSYYNQCAVMLASKGGGAKAYSGPTIKNALDYGMKRCNAEGKECSLYYTNCSMSEEYWVRQ